ncbi:MAG: PD-(D/E)XK nuclease family protein [Nitrospinae bacterium]|nr:PD-(D/E)XK nuclease family protein [Nitrospinota bacterium]
MSNKPTFPTGKAHVSYSEVRNWKECPYRHKLQQIDKIDMFEPSPYLDFGTNVHAGCESYLETGKIPKEELLQNVRDAWEKNGFDDPEWVKKQPGWYKYYPVEEWCTWASNMWDDVPGFLDKTFPGWVPVKAEEELYEPIAGKDMTFKGFIDVVIKVPRKNGTFKYWILDWKTSKSYGWDSRKKRDKLTHAQIILYKHYWATKHNIPLKDVGCGFILLKRGGRPGNMCELVPISAGPKAIERANKMVSSMISSVRKGLFFKNRESCRFCDYNNTVHCK